MATATHDELRALLDNSVDDVILERLEDTGATIDEVAEAIGSFELDESDDDLVFPSSARVAAVRAILSDAIDRENPDDAYSAP